MGKRDLFKVAQENSNGFSGSFLFIIPRMTIFEILEEGLTLHFPSLSNSDKKKNVAM